MNALKGDRVHATTCWSGHLEGTFRIQGNMVSSLNLNWREWELRDHPLSHRQRGSHPKNDDWHQCPMGNLICPHTSGTEVKCLTESSINSKGWVSSKKPEFLLLVTHLGLKAVPGMNLACMWRRLLACAVAPKWGAQADDNFLCSMFLWEIAHTWGCVLSVSRLPCQGTEM